MWHALLKWASENPAAAIGAVSSVLVFVTNGAQFLFTSAVSSIPAPTAQSTPRDVFWFQFLNKLAGNWSRANIPSIENSPNWEAALNAAIDKANASKKAG